MNRTAPEPVQPEAGTPYAWATSCTWHDLAGMAATRRRADHGSRLVCPHCGGQVIELSYEAFLRAAGAKDLQTQAMVQWSRGRCFPDADTLQNAYRQALSE